MASMRHEARPQDIARDMTDRPISDPLRQQRELNPRLNAGVYVFVTLDGGEELDASGVVATINEPEGTSVIIEAGAAAAAGFAPSPMYAWITLMVHSDLQSVGLTAAVSGALARAGIGCNVVAGTRHDHLFVAAGHAEMAMAELRALQGRARDSKS